MVNFVDYLPLELVKMEKDQYKNEIIQELRAWLSSAMKINVYLGSEADIKNSKHISLSNFISLLLTKCENRNENAFIKKI